MSEPDKERFLTALKQAGLDPAFQDTEGLFSAWLKLRQLMQRLRDPNRADDAQPLAVFDPSRLKKPDPGDSQ